MRYTDLHVHSTYCDGKSSIEEIILSAIEKNMKCIGISSHSYTDFDLSYCLKKERYNEYISEVKALKEKYKDKITVLCGIEQDVYSDASIDGFDYVIGSVHYFKTSEGYLPIDSSEEEFKLALENHFKNDLKALIRNYFTGVRLLPHRVKPDIIGHFNLISKYNEGFKIFDENDPYFIKEYTDTIDSLLPYQIPFEVNTGAISRGYRSFPYPNEEMIKYITACGGKLVFSSDSHHAKNLCFQFDEWKEYFDKLGIKIENFEK